MNTLRFLVLAAVEMYLKKRQRHYKTNKHKNTQSSFFIPVLHEADLAFSGDLLSGALGRKSRGRGHDYPGSNGAGRGCSDLIGLNVT